MAFEISSLYLPLPGWLCWWKEGHRDLRPRAPAEVLPEDPDQAGEGAREEVLRQACRVHRPEEDPPQAHQEDQQAEAEEAQVWMRINLHLWTLCENARKVHIAG